MRSLALVCLLVGCGSVSNDKKQDAAVTPDDATVTDDALPDTAMATCAPTPTGLRARYRAENNADDKTGSFPGTAVGASFTYVPGKYGQAFSLDGVDDHVAIADLEQLWPNDQSLTLEGWIKMGDATTSHTVVCKYACGDQCPNNLSLAYYCLYVNGSGFPVFDFRADAEQDYQQVVASTVTVDDNNWHHLVAVKNNVAQSATMYVDGVSVATITPAAAAFGAMTDDDSSPDPVTIGAAAVAGNTTYESRFVGQLDEVAIYHSALTAAEVTAIYNAPEGKCL